MRVRVTIGVLLVVVLAFFSQVPVRAGRSVTLPHNESFAAATSWQDLKWVSQGAVGQHVSGAQVWDGGGAARFWLPTLNQGYAGLGQFSFPATTRLNVRFVYQYGSAYILDDAGAGPKHLIVNRTGSDVRFIAQQHEFGACGWDLGLGNGISPQYPNPRIWNYCDHVGQPIVFEFEAIVGGSYKVWITKRNDPNWNERLLITVPSAAGGSWNMIDILGAFGGPAKGGNADPEAWFQISNLVISDSYIGPPAGFVSGSTQCTYALSPGNASLSADASSGTVALTTGSSCAWTINSSAPWLTVATNAGSGAATLTYSVTANTGATRTATLSVNGQTFTVTQSGVTATCAFTIQPTSVSLPATASTGSVAVTASPTGCAPTSFTVSGGSSWITATTSGMSVGYAVQSNTLTTARTATLTIANQSFVVTQAGTTASPPPPPNGCSHGGTTYTPGTVKRFQLTVAAFDATATALEAAGWELHYAGASTSYVFVIAKCPKP